MTHLRLACAIASIVLAPAGSAIQARDPSRLPVDTQAAVQKETARDAARKITAAREFLAAGHEEEALEAVNQVLKQDPANREAIFIKIAVLLQQQSSDRALAAYDVYAGALKKPDVGVLEPIARAELEQWLKRPHQDPGVVTAALERLAREGDARALDALKRAAASPGVSSEPREAVEPVLSLARLGDKDAMARLGTLLESAPADRRSEIIGWIQDAGIRSQAPKIVPSLGDSRPDVRAAAALALGVLQFTDATPRLQELFKQDVPLVQIFAAAALRLLGQASVDEYLARILATGAPEVRLIAARAYQASDTKRWIPSVKELLGDRNELTRVRAAELLACCDRPAARAALLAALDSANPLLRREAARVLEGKGLADGRVMRRLLGDPEIVVRVHGAGAVMQWKGPGA